LRKKSPKTWPKPGLPDGLFSNQKSKFGYIWEGLAMEDVGIFYGLLSYFMEIWCTVRGNLVFLPVLVFCNKKNLATLAQTIFCQNAQL
jgi:hypothetical protein